MADLLQMQLRNQSSVPAGAVNPLIGITVEHFRNHEGRAFEAQNLWPTATPIANGASVYVLINTDGEHVHSDFAIDAQGSFEFELFEGPTITDMGTSIPVVCRNYELNNSINVVVTHTPTVSADGTRKRIGLIAAGQGNKAGGGRGSFDAEMLLKSATSYLLRLTNVSGSAQALGFTMQFYI